MLHSLLTIPRPSVGNGLAFNRSDQRLTFVPSHLAILQAKYFTWTFKVTGVLEGRKRSNFDSIVNFIIHFMEFI